MIGYLMIIGLLPHTVDIAVERTEDLSHRVGRVVAYDSPRPPVLYETQSLVRFFCRNQTFASIAEEVHIVGAANLRSYIAQVLQLGIERDIIRVGANDLSVVPRVVLHIPHLLLPAVTPGAEVVLEVVVQSRQTGDPACPDT